MSLSAHHSQIIFNNEWLLAINVNAGLCRSLCPGSDIVYFTSFGLTEQFYTVIIKKKTISLTLPSNVILHLFQCLDKHINYTSIDK